MTGQADADAWNAPLMGLCSEHGTLWSCGCDGCEVALQQRGAPCPRECGHVLDVHSEYFGCWRCDCMYGRPVKEGGHRTR